MCLCVYVSVSVYVKGKLLEGNLCQREHGIERKRRPSVSAKVIITVLKDHKQKQLEGKGFVLTLPDNTPSLIKLGAGTQTGQKTRSKNSYRSHGGVLLTG